MNQVGAPSPDSSAAPRRRVSAARALLALALVAALGYGGAIAWLVTQETSIIFQAGRPLGEARPPFAYEQVDLPRRDGSRQLAWVMKHPDARSWVLFLHGNAATIASRVNIARYRELRELGLNVIAPEYRGFAGLPGTPSEAGLAEDARAAFDYLTGTLLVGPPRVVIYGWSLGSAVAVDLAANVPAGAVILEGALASVVALGQQHYPIFPIRLIIRNPFESIDKVHRITAPLLFLHSPEDDVIPIAEGRRLYDAARSPKRFVEVRGGHIYANDVDRAVFFGAIRAFLDEYGLLGHQE
ncbi:MAG: alpha/beta hydrolase [Vicinamibacterales bacterium]